MSDIKVGDMVIVTRAHCEKASMLGKVWTVVRGAYAISWIAPGRTLPGLRCVACDTDFDWTGPVFGLANGVTSGTYPMAWVKKIEPLAEPEAELKEAFEPA